MPTKQYLHHPPTDSRVPQAVLFTSMMEIINPRMENRRPRNSVYSPSSMSFYNQGNPEEDLKDYAIHDRDSLEDDRRTTPRKNDVYSLDLKNIIPSGGITCLVAKATEDEAVLWHRRLGHVKPTKISPRFVKKAICNLQEDWSERTVQEPLAKAPHGLFGTSTVESINKKKVQENQLMNEFCAQKGIKREIALPRGTPQAKWWLQKERNMTP
ncbi:hypothetical protein Tco_1165952 [Tanacetum coccineum]